jgi:hypothetical protein
MSAVRLDSASVSSTNVGHVLFPDMLDEIVQPFSDFHLQPYHDAGKLIEYLLKRFITAAEMIPHLRCRLNSSTMHSIWRMCVNVIPYFDTWLVAPYFVRGSSVLIAEGLQTNKCVAEHIRNPLMF